MAYRMEPTSRSSVELQNSKEVGIKRKLQEKVLKEPVAVCECPMGE